MDGRSVKEVLGSARSLLPRLRRALLDGTYQPGDIRRVWIPKPGGGQCGLGIPNVMDAKICELTPRTWGQSLTRCIERINVCLRGWSGYFRICTEENVYRLHVWDAHIRRRLRAILVRQKKRPRHLCRYLQHRRASARGATHTAWCRRGTWYRSNTPGMTVACRNAWFHECLVSLAFTWEDLNPCPKLASGQTLLFDL